MTFKPEIVPQTQVVEEIRGLTDQREKLRVQAEQLEHKLKLVEASLAENDHLAVRVKELMAESLALFEDEQKRKSEYYPDLWLSAMEQALIAVVPPPKK